jgi:hypothetical protein
MTLSQSWSLCYLLAFPTAAFGQDPPLFADRPDFTESPAVLSRGRIQFEGGWTAQGDDRLSAHAFGAVVRAGFSGRWEAWIEGTWLAMDDARGAEVTGRGDADVGGKLALGPIAGPTSAASLLVSSSVPIGEDGIGERGWQPEARVLFGWELAGDWSLGANAGAGLPLVAGERFGQVLESISVGCAIRPGLGVVAEVYGIHPADKDGADAAYVDGGLGFALGGGATLDLRAGVGLTEAASDWLFGLELTQGWRSP